MMHGIEASPEVLGRYEFFLGGRDLEMETIRELLAEAGARFHDKRLHWGAKASHYGSEIRAATRSGKTPVLVELEDDLGLQEAFRVDHHGDKSGAEKETSLHQVFSLLGLSKSSWTRRFELVAANDRGHIAAMKKIGASDDEIVEIRNQDRAAQRVTSRDEELAKQAVSQARVLEGFLTAVDLPHSRTSPVADFLDPVFGGPGADDLLVICPRELNFFGRGALVEALKQRFPNSWHGGSLPDRGFWGAPISETCDGSTVLQFLLSIER